MADQEILPISLVDMWSLLHKYESFPVFMGGPRQVFVSLWVDLRKLSCLYGWTCGSFPVIMGGTTKAFLSSRLDLLQYELAGLWQTKRYYLSPLLTSGAYFFLCLTNRIYYLPSLLICGAYFLLCLTNRSLPASIVEMPWR
jgi:hypothetical protein